MNTETLFEGLPTDTAPLEEETITVEWSLLASRQLANALARIERYLSDDSVTSAINHMLIFHRQGGSPVQDWALAYTNFNFELLSALESDDKLQMVLSFSLDAFKPQAVQTDDTIEVFAFSEARKTPEERTLIDLQVYRGDWTPPREAMSEVTDRNNQLLRELEEVVSEHFGLDDPDKQLNPLVEMFLVSLGIYLESEFTLVDDGMEREGSVVTLHLTHNARPMRLDLAIDLEAFGLQYEKMLREMP